MEKKKIWKWLNWMLWFLVQAGFFTGGAVGVGQRQRKGLSEVASNAQKKLCTVYLLLFYSITLSISQSGTHTTRSHAHKQIIVSRFSV